MLHFNAGLSLDIWSSMLALNGSQTLVTRLVGPFELHVRGRARSHEDRQPVLEGVALGERAVAVGLDEFMRVQVFSRCLAPTNQEEVVDPERRGIRPSQSTVNDHCPGDTQDIDCFAKGEIVARLVYQDVRQAGTKQEERKDSGGTDKGEEVPVVAPADTVVKPDAVVV